MKKTILTALAILLLAMPILAAPRPQPRPRVDPALVALEGELQRFPNRDLCRACIHLADEHMEWLRMEALLHPERRADICEYGTQVSGWREVWVWLEDARTPIYFPEYRRIQLAKVRAAIGEEAYNLGFVWPPVAAHWLYQD